MFGISAVSFEAGDGAAFKVGAHDIDQAQRRIAPGRGDEPNLGAKSVGATNELSGWTRVKAQLVKNRDLL